jgi:hypothetical protein
MWRIIADDLVRKLRTDPKVQELVNGVEAKVVDGRMTPGDAAERMLSRFLE